MIIKSYVLEIFLNLDLMSLIIIVVRYYSMFGSEPREQTYSNKNAISVR